MDAWSEVPPTCLEGSRFSAGLARLCPGDRRPGDQALAGTRQGFCDQKARVHARFRGPQVRDETARRPLPAGSLHPCGQVTPQVPAERHCQVGQQGMVRGPSSSREAGKPEETGRGPPDGA